MSPQQSLDNSDAPPPKARLPADQLLPLVYTELRRIAGGCLAQERPGQTLQATALVHEAWIKLGGDREFENRTHFIRMAATAMRQILVDNARAKCRQKRGNGEPSLELEESLIPTSEPAEHILMLNDALETFSKEHPIAAQIVEMRYFLGMNISEIAGQLGASPRSVDRQWAFARAWLKRELRRHAPDSVDQSDC